jgi:opacity protein-like surface antigen
VNKKIISISVIALCLSASTSAFAASAKIKNQGHESSSHEVSKRMYVRGSVVAPLYRPMDDFKPKFKLGGSLAVGYEFNDHVSAELEGLLFSRQIQYITSDPAESDVRNMRTHAVFANLAYRTHLVNSPRVEVFGGIGVGFAKNKTSAALAGTGLHNQSSPSSKNRLAYQAFVGCEWMLNSRISLIADAKWARLGTANTIDIMATGSPPTRNVYKYKVNVQTFSVGAKFKF